MAQGKKECPDCGKTHPYFECKPMTPNDKLPKEITDQINKEADKYGFVVPYDGSNTFYIDDKVKGYQAGATAWAPWKVKFDELQAQAQRMADALEQCSSIASWMDDPYRNKIVEIVSKALQQFKDGTKEVEPVKEIEYMPIHPEDARKFDCPTQFPMHLLSEGQAQSNHGQSLKRLKERGGLSVREILAIVGKKGWNYYGNLKWPEAIKMLNDILTNPK